MTTSTQHTNGYNKSITKKKQTDTTPQDVWLIRLLLLTFYASRGSLQPFLSVYFHNLGHSGDIVGLLVSLQFLLTFLMSPLWGMVADKYFADKRHVLLKRCLMVFAMTQLLLPLHDKSVVYLVAIVLVKSCFQAPLMSLVDSVVMDHLSDKSQFGRFRLFGTLGFGLGQAVVGFLMSRANATSPPLDESTLDKKFWQDLDLGGYRVAFIAFGVLSMACFMCIQALHPSSHQKSLVVKAKNMATTKETAKIKDGLQMLLQNRDAVMFLFLVFVQGLSIGCSDNFTYVRYEEVGATKSFIGSSRLVASTCGTVMFWYSHLFMDWLGGEPLRVLLLSPLLYAIRFIMYANMSQPYQAIPAEMLRGINFAAVCSVSTTYAHEVSPPGMTITMLTFQNAMKSGLGPSLGAIITGKLQSIHGTTATFVCVAIFNVCFVALAACYLELVQGKGKKGIGIHSKLEMNGKAKAQ